MTDQQRQQLGELARKAIMLGAKDPRWGVVQGWQRAGLVRAVAVTKRDARIEVTDKGRAALREGASNG